VRARLTIYARELQKRALSHRRRESRQVLFATIASYGGDADADADECKPANRGEGAPRPRQRPLRKCFFLRERNSSSASLPSAPPISFISRAGVRSLRPSLLEDIATARERGRGGERALESAFKRLSLA